MNNFIIHSVIIHEIVKQPESAEAEVILSENKLPITENVISMIADLDARFERRSDVLQGYLPYIAGEETMLDLYMHDEPEDVVRSTQDMTRLLQGSLQGVIGARGGHLVFSDYTVDEQRIFACFFLRDTMGIRIQRATESGWGDVDQIEVSEVELTDLGKMPVAVRVLRGDGRVVQVLRPSRSRGGIFNHFLEWVGMGPSHTSAELTEQFMEVLEELPVPKDPETGYAMDESDFETALIKYAAKQPQQRIRVKDFDDNFYPGEKSMQTMLEKMDDALNLGDGFRVDNKMLKAGHHMKAKDNGMVVQCTRRHVRSGIVDIDEEAGIIVIRSEELASMLIDQQA